MSRGVTERLLATLPARYRPGFVEQLDRRTVLGRAVQDRITAMEADLGGVDSLSHARRSLVRRAVWLELAVEAHELHLPEGVGLDAGAYSQLFNSYLGALRLLGIERKARPVRSLHDHLAKRSGTPPQPAPGTRRSAPPIDGSAERVAAPAGSEDAPA